MKILVTGGAGYIGSHTCLKLLKSGHDVIVVDNLSGGNIEALERIKRDTNRELVFHKCDIRDIDSLNKIFEDFRPESVIHFAGLKAVNESISEPVLYYDVNVGGTAILLSAMENVDCVNFVFSSSATVYGEPLYLPCNEGHPTNPSNPYGRTKLIVEELLADWVRADSSRHAVALRYFNPVGAEESGLIGEAPNVFPNNLMPFIAQVAVGKREQLIVYGNDYETIDGTGVRDYIHVSDLASAHVAAVEKINSLLGFEAINIGTGHGISVLEMVHEFEQQSGQKVNYKFAPRRSGDISAIWADTSLAKQKLDFTAQYGISDMCKHTWIWQSANPSGYRTTNDTN